MSKLRRPEQLDLLPYIAKWLALAGLVALLAGSASAFFLFSLDHATQWRETHPWVIWLLPVAGFAVGLAYHLMGKPVDAGNNLIIDEIHDPKKIVPLRMVAPSSRRTDLCRPWRRSHLEWETDACRWSSRRRRIASEQMSLAWEAMEIRWSGFPQRDSHLRGIPAVPPMPAIFSNLS